MGWVKLINFLCARGYLEGSEHFLPMCSESPKVILPWVGGLCMEVSCTGILGHKLGGLYGEGGFTVGS